MSVLLTTLSLDHIHSEASKVGFEKRAKSLSIPEGLLHVVRKNISTKNHTVDEPGKP